MKRSRYPADWQQVAEFAKGITFCHVMMPILGTALAVVCGIGFVVVDPTPAGIVKAATLVFVTWPVCALLAVCISFLPNTIFVHTRLLKCAQQQPVAEDEADARDVEWCLLHLQWLHRLACRVRGRDYESLLEICRKARPEDREVAGHEQAQSMTTMDLVRDQFSQMAALTARDVFQRAKSGRGILPKRTDRT